MKRCDDFKRIEHPLYNVIWGHSEHIEVLWRSDAELFKVGKVSSHLSGEAFIRMILILHAYHLWRSETWTLIAHINID